MKYIIDTDKLPCNNGKNCTTCPFWSVDDTCEITEQVKKLPKYEEQPHGECNQCRYYDGVQGVQGHAPCWHWNIGGVMWNDYCSRFEKEGEKE